jgi:hypothetical protein
MTKPEQEKKRKKGKKGKEKKRKKGRNNHTSPSASNIEDIKCQGMEKVRRKDAIVFPGGGFKMEVWRLCFSRSRRTEK